MKKNNFIGLSCIILIGYFFFPTIIFETKFFEKIIIQQGFDKHYELLKTINSAEIINSIYICILVVILYYILITISIKYKVEEDLQFENLFYPIVYTIFIYHLFNDWYDYYIIYSKLEFSYNRYYIYENFVFNRKLNYIWLVIPALINNSIKYRNINILIIILLFINSIITLSRFEIFVTLVLFLFVVNFPLKTKISLFFSLIIIISLRIIITNEKFPINQISWELISYRISYLYERLTDPFYINLYGSDIIPNRPLSRAGFIDILTQIDKIILISILIAFTSYSIRKINFILPSVIATSLFKAYRGGIIDALFYCLKYIIFIIIIIIGYKLLLRIKKYYV